MMIFFFFCQLDTQILYFNTFITFFYMFRAFLCSSSGGQLYYYNIWSRHALWVTVQYTGYGRTHYTPLHVSSTLILIFRRTIVLTQHLVSSLSLGDCAVHRLRKDTLYSSTCFEHSYAHLQEDNCISTASGIVTVFR